MLNRRDYLKKTLLLSSMAAMPACMTQALQHSGIIRRSIPKTGEKLPIVGLGTSATFRRVAGSEDVSPLKEVLQTLVQHGGTVVDTANGYNDAEEISGKLARDSGLTEKIFWATKANAVPRGGDTAAPDAVRAQIEQSEKLIGKKPIDLIQVHNVADIPTQLPIIQEYKDAGRIRYVGTTSTRKSQYDTLIHAMRNYPIDFIGIDYAVDNRSAADIVLPLARDRGIAVLVYVPFGRTRLWDRVKGREVPEWAREFGAESWGQFFIKYAAAHQAVTCVTPATSKAKHMLDNMGAAYGTLPGEKLQRRMEAYIDGLPSA
ncbi:MAG: aldo/keto reductase [Gammaproteobacteria bacterium]|nr:aldo/keto reductase [Gammaproteobacteria bacterium]NNC77550.1 aldo/keto reductase [Woeseiaceae bacterium]